MIREVKRADIPACVSVIRSSFQTVADEFGFTIENAPRFTAFAVTQEQLFRQLEEEHRLMFLNEEDGVICGFYSLRLMEDGACELGNLSVLPAYRHGGIGSKLLKHAVETAKSLNRLVMKLSVVEENVRLLRWYERHGAVHTGTEKYDFFPFACGFMIFRL